MKTMDLFDYAARDAVEAYMAQPGVRPAELSLRQKYEAWAASDYGKKVIATVIDRAMTIKALGWKQYSIATLWETIRWEYDTKFGPRPADDDKFQMNNNWKPFVARQIMEEHPEFDGFFETRQQRAGG
jgi:hypothetical protein